MPDSSQPGRTIATSVPSRGSATSRSTRAITAATPVALSLAPGTVPPSRPPATGRSRAPAARAGVRRRRGPTATAAIANSGNSENGGRPSREAPAARRGFHISPVWAASWCATSTRVRRRSPLAGSRATTLAPSPRAAGAAATATGPTARARRTAARPRPRASGQRSRAVEGVCIAEGVLVAKRLGAHLLRPGVPEPRRAPFRGLPLALASGAATHGRQRLHVGADRHVRCQSTGPAVSGVTAQRSARELPGRRGRRRAADRGRCRWDDPSRGASRRGPRSPRCRWPRAGQGIHPARRMTTRTTAPLPRARPPRWQAPDRACCGSGRSARRLSLSAPSPYISRTCVGLAMPVVSPKAISSQPASRSLRAIENTRSRGTSPS